MPPAKSKERTSVAMAPLKLDHAGFQAIKSCRAAAAVHRRGNKLQDEIQALRDLFSTWLFAEESTEMTLSIFKLELCGGRMQ